MKTIKKVIGATLSLTMILGVVLLFSKCTKTKTDTITNTVTNNTVTHDTTNNWTHDTVRYPVHMITGAVTYPNFYNTMVPAPGAIISLYLNIVSNNPTATTFADSAGNYKFIGLSAGNYYIDASYNTANQNVHNPINGINFGSNTYNVVISNSDMMQNITLQTITDTGLLNVSINPADTMPSQKTSGVQFVTVEGHANVSFSVEFSDSNKVGEYLNGTFGTTDQAPNPGFVVSQFRFDQVNPALSYFKGYVLNKRVNTGYAARDTGWALGTKCCETVFWSRDTTMAPGWGKLTEESDTAYYWANAGQISTYGKGYLAKGTLAPVWKHSGTVPVAGKVKLPLPDTGYGYTGQLGWDKRIQLPTDMYFEYQGAKKIVKGASFTWHFIFEAQMHFNPRSFYMKAGVGNDVTVNISVDFPGLKNENYAQAMKKKVLPPSGTPIAREQQRPTANKTVANPAKQVNMQQSTKKVNQK